MSVSKIADLTGMQRSAAAPEKNNAEGFSVVLEKAVFPAEASLPLSSLQKAAGDLDNQNIIILGKITKETPTVSHILKDHEEYTDRCWEIIHASGNRGKDFTRLREGTVVALKRDSRELIWGSELPMTAREKNAASSGNRPDSTGDPGPAGDPVVIGTISREKPTVSHLFQAYPGYDNRFWDIIHSPVNSSNPYRTLRPGTRVLLDPASMKISFSDTLPEHPEALTARTASPEQHKSVNSPDHYSLADAVKTYIGTPYNEIDCYALVVRGLTNQGIQYAGHGGLREHLESLALSKGLPPNAYFSGEGLVEKAGTPIFFKSIEKMSNSEQKAEEIYSEMTPYLREGLILSFSTPTRGHTGIVSRQGKHWTYINSGVIDNQVSPGRVSKRVGEEILKAEIRNWCLLAKGREEPLRVTVGLVNRNHLQGAGLVQQKI